MNHKGMTFVETCLTLVILMLVVGLIIPMSYQLRTTMLSIKLDYYASEVALEAAKMLNTFGETKGTKVIDQVRYDWYYNGDELCVSYKKISTLEKKCINSQNQS